MHMDIAEMADEESAMCEKIIWDIDSILNTDQSLHQFEILTASAANDRNKSPVRHEQHCMGVEHWCVKFLLSHLRHVLFRRKYDRTFNRYLNVAVLLCPEVLTYWNMKRELVTRRYTGAAFELHVAGLVLTHKPKSAEAYAYCRWLHDAQGLPVAGDQNLALLAAICDRVPNNYHAWTHRQFLFQRLSALAAGEEQVALLLRDEMRFSLDWMFAHVSEHSGFHYRQFVLGRCRLVVPPKRIAGYIRMCDDPVGRRKSALYTQVIDKVLKRATLSHDFECSVGNLDSKNNLSFFVILAVELVCVLRELHRVFPAHEAIFYHRRFVLYHLLDVVYSSASETKWDEDGFRNLAEIPNTRRRANITKSLSLNDDDGEVCAPEKKRCVQQLRRIQSNPLVQALLRDEGDFLAVAESSCVAQVGVGTVDQADLLRKHRLWLKYLFGIRV